jgi:hypothetical protein
MEGFDPNDPLASLFEEVFGLIEQVVDREMTDEHVEEQLQKILKEGHDDGEAP